MKHFVENAELVKGKIAKTLYEMYPDASAIIKVDGGYMVFDYVTELETWRNQK